MDKSLSQENDGEEDSSTRYLDENTSQISLSQLVAKVNLERLNIDNVSNGGYEINKNSSEEQEDSLMVGNKQEKRKVSSFLPGKLKGLNHNGKNDFQKAFESSDSDDSLVPKRKKVSHGFTKTRLQILKASKKQSHNNPFEKAFDSSTELSTGSGKTLRNRTTSRKENELNNAFDTEDSLIEKRKKTTSAFRSKKFVTIENQVRDNVFDNAFESTTELSIDLSKISNFSSNDSKTTTSISKRTKTSCFSSKMNRIKTNNDIDFQDAFNSTNESTSRSNIGGNQSKSGEISNPQTRFNDAGGNKSNTVNISSIVNVENNRAELNDVSKTVNTDSSKVDGECEGRKVVEDEEREESKVVEDEEREESKVVEDEEREESKVVEDEEREESKVVEDEEREESKVVEDEEREESKVVEDEEREESKVVEGEEREESKVVEDEEHEINKVVEDEEREESKVVEDEESEESKVVEEEEDEDSDNISLMKRLISNKSAGSQHETLLRTSVILQKSLSHNNLLSASVYDTKIDSRSYRSDHSFNQSENLPSDTPILKFHCDYDSMDSMSEEDEEEVVEENKQGKEDQCEEDVVHDTINDTQSARNQSNTNENENNKLSIASNDISAGNRRTRSSRGAQNQTALTEMIKKKQMLKIDQNQDSMDFTVNSEATQSISIDNFSNRNESSGVSRDSDVSINNRSSRFKSGKQNNAIENLPISEETSARKIPRKRNPVRNNSSVRNKKRSSVENKKERTPKRNDSSKNETNNFDSIERIVNEIPFSELRPNCKRRTVERNGELLDCVMINEAFNLKKYNLQNQIDELADPDEDVLENKAPKLKRPHKWVSNDLYKFIVDKLEPVYGFKSRRRAERFVLYLSEKYNSVIRENDKTKYKIYVDELQLEMAKLKLIITPWDFYTFIHKYLPYCFLCKSIPQPKFCGKPRTVDLIPKEMVFRSIL